MTRWLQSSCVCVVTAGMLILARDAVAQNGSLAAAHDLSVAAAYDEALGMLNGLRGSARREDVGPIEQYRALCLLALGRSGEADSAMEAAVAAAPFAQPSETDVSPRIRSTFRDVRKRVLPAIVERQYADAKAAFDRKDPSATERFSQVIALLGDPDLQDPTPQPKWAQMRAMATDFMALSTPKASPPPTPAPLPVQPTYAAPIAATPVRDRSHVYTLADANVAPPIPVYQSSAPMANIFALRPGSVEVVIDELGTVIAAATNVSVNGVYDRHAIATAKTWRYRPAVLNGVAVKFKMIVQLQIQPRQ